MRHVIAIDQGTTGSTVLVLDEKLAVRGRGYQEFRQIYPQPGWVEHDPEDIWASVARRARRRRSKGIDAVVDRRDRHHEPARDRGRCGTARPARPAHNAIVWQDRRTADRCAELKAERQGGARQAAHRPHARPVLLGHEGPLDARQRRRRSPRRARRRARVRHRRFATCCGGSPAARCTRPTSRTRRARCCSTSTTLAWSDELLEMLGVPRALLPEVVAVVGHRSARPRACPACPTASRSRASPAISSRRCSARRASRPATRSARTAPARSS